MLTGTVAGDKNILPLLVKSGLVKLPLVWFALELLVQGISQRDKGGVQEIHSEL